MKRVCVFCGSSPGRSPVYRDAAREMGRTLARRGIGLVFGGGHVGLMGAVADGALEEGGDVIGVIPDALVEKELAHPRATQMVVVRTMHERKARMVELASAFVALPGGFGTLDELCEVLTWAQLGIHAKPCGLLNVEGYFDPFLAFLDHATSDGFIRPEHRGMLVVERDAAKLLDRLAETRPPALPKWVRPDEA